MTNYYFSKKRKDYKKRTMADDHLWNLKREGHKLLDEYIFLDVHHGSVYAERKHAYAKLETKLTHLGTPSHFGDMDTVEEVEHAIAKLKKMIKARKSKIERFGPDSVNIQFAPNLRELQKLNPNSGISIETSSCVS